MKHFTRYEQELPVRNVRWIHYDELFTQRFDTKGDGTGNTDIHLATGLTDFKVSVPKGMVLLLDRIVIRILDSRKLKADGYAGAPKLPIGLQLIIVDDFGVTDFDFTKEGNIRSTTDFCRLCQYQLEELRNGNLMRAAYDFNIAHLAALRLDPGVSIVLRVNDNMSQLGLQGHWATAQGRIYLR